MDLRANKLGSTVDAADTDNLNKFIRCPECGEEIQMTPSLDDMITVIEEHISLHKEHPKSELNVDRIKTPYTHNDLTVQTSTQTLMPRDAPKDSTWIHLK